MEWGAYAPAGIWIVALTFYDYIIICPYLASHGMNLAFTTSYSCQLFTTIAFIITNTVLIYHGYNVLVNIISFVVYFNSIMIIYRVTPIYLTNEVICMWRCMMSTSQSRIDYIQHLSNMKDLIYYCNNYFQNNGDQVECWRTLMILFDNLILILVNQV